VAQFVFDCEDDGDCDSALLNQRKASAIPAGTVWSWEFRVYAVLTNRPGQWDRSKLHGEGKVYPPPRSFLASRSLGIAGLDLDEVQVFCYGINKSLPVVFRPSRSRWACCASRKG
jgi:hypothetical protein